MSKKFVLALAFATSALPFLAHAGTIQLLKTQAPEGILVPFQMTDGTVIGQSFNYQHWYKLTPDKTGSYVNGTWSRIADLPANYSPLYFASQVFADGRLAIIGGEYSFGDFGFINLGAIYDPLTNKWTNLKAPKGSHWNFIGDSSSAILPDGRFLVAQKFHEDLAAYDPKTGKWQILAFTGKSDFNAEEGLTLLPDGRLLTYDVKNHPNSEIYDPATQTWTSAGSTVADLHGPAFVKKIKYGKHHIYRPPGEVGPGILRPDGSVFAEGSQGEGEPTAHTAIFKNGTWSAGPDFPGNVDAGDSFSTLLPSGNVLMEPRSTTELYEFDGTSIIPQSVNGDGSSLMILPTGQVLLGGSGVYNATGSPKASWAPTITDFPATVTRGSSYPISGTQFNGLSQANAYGDENETSTNYPLVRITNTSTGHVFYARTHDHSTMGVATGKTTVSTSFDVAAGTETGASTLVVVANGIPSKSVSITVN